MHPFAVSNRDHEPIKYPVPGLLPPGETIRLGIYEYKCNYNRAALVASMPDTYIHTYINIHINIHTHIQYIHTYSSPLSTIHTYLHIYTHIY